MSDPIRWKDADDAPPVFRRALADAGEIPRMPAELRAAVRSAVVLAEASLAPGSAMKGSLSQARALPAAKGAVGLFRILALGAVAATALALVVFVASRGRSDADPATKPSPSSPPTAAVEPPVSDPTASASPSESSSGVAAVPTLAPTSPSRTVAPSTSVHGGPTDNLAEENALITRARQALASEPELALREAEAHARKFPHGALEMERDSVRMNALRRLGRQGEAKAAARRFLSAYPSSPYAAAAREILREGAP